MYCRKCGYKLDSDARACDECGTLVDGTEYCGGFWGLVNDEEKLTDNEKKQKNSSSGKVSVHKSNTFIILCLLLLIVAVQTFRVSSVSNQLDTQNQEYQILFQKYKQLLQKNNELMKPNNNVRDNENVEEYDAGSNTFSAEEYDPESNFFKNKKQDSGEKTLPNI